MDQILTTTFIKHQHTKEKKTNINKMGRKNKNIPINNRQHYNRQHMAKVKHDNY